MGAPPGQRVPLTKWGKIETVRVVLAPGARVPLPAMSCSVPQGPVMPLKEMYRSPRVFNDWSLTGCFMLFVTVTDSFRLLG